MAKGFDAEKKRLVTFIAEHLYAKQEDEAPLRNFRVTHHQEGTTKANLVTQAHVRPESNPDVLAENVIIACQGDADASGGVHRYVVRAMYGVKSEESRGGRHIIKLRGEEGKDDDDTLDGIEVGPRGVLSMTMRHQEGILKYALLHGTEIMERQGVLLDKVISRLESAENRSMQLFDITQKMADDRLQRELEARKQLRREKREDLAISLAMRYLPGMLAEKTGGPNAALVEVVAGLDDEQIAQIHDTLNPEQRKRFLPVVLKVLKERAAEEKKAKEEQEKSEAEAKRILDEAEGKAPAKQLTIDASFTEIVDPLAGPKSASAEKKEEKSATPTPFAVFLAGLTDDELASVKAVLSAEELAVMLKIADGEGPALGAWVQSLDKEKAAKIAGSMRDQARLDELQALIVKSLTEGKLWRATIWFMLTALRVSRT